MSYAITFLLGAAALKAWQIRAELKTLFSEWRAGK
jgi:hypothetical protein